jgi:uncharacterized membrane protein (UPF0182 family)
MVRKLVMANSFDEALVQIFGTNAPKLRHITTETPVDQPSDQPRINLPTNLRVSSPQSR